MKNIACLPQVLFFLACAAFPPMVTAQQDDNREWESRRAEAQRQAVIREWESERAESRRDSIKRADEARRRPVPRGRSLITPQLYRDYRRIQVLNDELRQTALRSDGLDLEFVAKSVSEINKCAKRLRGGLALQKAEVNTNRPGTQVETEPNQLRSSLKALGELIVAFVNNPAFKDTRMVNAKSWVNAGRELEEIIELSSGLKKSSSKLASRERSKR